MALNTVKIYVKSIEILVRSPKNFLLVNEHEVEGTNTSIKCLMFQYVLVRNSCWNTDICSIYMS